MSSRIRVGFIGLSTTSFGTNWGGVAHLPYLQSAQGKARFDIVALCNSSVESAKKSIEHYKLSESVKAYGSPEELAKDPDVDLVVNVTHVSNHYPLCLAVAKAGKNVYTELPFAQNMNQMTELLDTAQSKGIKTIFGMQGNTAPSTKLLKEVIASGRIGKVLSTAWTGYWDNLGDKPVPIGYKRNLFREAGADNLSVTFLHSYNHIAAVLGDLKSFNSILGIQRPIVKLIDPKQDNKLVETVEKTVPDHVYVQGRFESDALLTWNFRTGSQFPGQPGFSWEIYGEKGAIFLKGGFAMSDISNAGVSIQLKEFGKDDVETLSLPKDELSDLPDPVQNVGRIYDSYAKGEEGVYPDWKLAMKRHKLIEQIWSQYDGKSPSGEPVKP